MIKRLIACITIRNCLKYQTIELTFFAFLVCYAKNTTVKLPGLLRGWARMFSMMGRQRDRNAQTSDSEYGSRRGGAAPENHGS